MADEPTPTGQDTASAWLNDESEYQGCFVCGARNPCGLHIRFWSAGTMVITEFTGDVAHQGFPGVLHGGILAALLDEALNRVSLLEQRWTMTARLEIRYRAPVPTGVRLRIEAEATDSRARLVRAKGRIVRADDPAVVLCEGEGTFMPLSDDVRDQAIRDRPELRSFFAGPGSS